MKAGTVSALVPNQFSNGNGKVSWVGWSLFGITITALVYNIIQSHQTITSNKETIKNSDLEIAKLRDKVKELEHNVRSSLGGNYQSL